jgi:flagellin-specific chaperone FliS
MINTLNIFHELQETLDTRAAEKIAEIIGNVYDELHNTVTKEEFRELTTIECSFTSSQ